MRAYIWVGLQVVGTLFYALALRDAFGKDRPAPTRGERRFLWAAGALQLAAWLAQFTFWAIP